MLSAFRCPSWKQGWHFIDTLFFLKLETKLLQQYGTVSTHTKNMMSTVQYQNPYPTRSDWLIDWFQIHSCCSKTPVQYISRIPTNTELPQKTNNKGSKIRAVERYPLTQLPLKKKSLTFFTAHRPVQRTTYYTTTALTYYYDKIARSTGISNQHPLWSSPTPNSHIWRWESKTIYSLLRL